MLQLLDVQAGDHLHIILPKVFLSRKTALYFCCFVMKNGEKLGRDNKSRFQHPNESM